VLIIGGGITGTSCSYWLRKNNIEDVLLVESRGICSGATGRNGGHMWPHVRIPSNEDINKYGLEEMKRDTLFNFETIKLIQEFIKEYNIDCELKIRGAVELIRFEDEIEFYRNSIEDLKKN